MEEKMKTNLKLIIFGFLTAQIFAGGLTLIYTQIEGGATLYLVIKGMIINNGLVLLILACWGISIGFASALTEKIRESDNQPKN